MSASFKVFSLVFVLSHRDSECRVQRELHHAVQEGLVSDGDTRESPPVGAVGALGAAASAGAAVVGGVSGEILVIWAT